MKPPSKKWLKWLEYKRKGGTKSYYEYYKIMII